MNIKNLSGVLLVSSLLMVLSGCSKNDSSKPEPKSLQETLTQVPDLTINQGSFTAVGDYDELVKSGTEDSKEMNSIGCDEEIRKFDPLIKAGDREIERIVTYTQGGLREMVLALEVLSIDEKRIQVQEKYNSLSLGNLGDVMLKPGSLSMISTTQITADNNVEYDTKFEPELTEEEIFNLITPAGKDFLKKNESSIQYCQIKNGQYKLGPTQVGKYKLPNGAEVKAYKKETRVTGDVYCREGSNDVKVGEGEEVNIRYTTNEILPLKDLYICGGRELLQTTKVSFGEKVIFSELTESLTSRLRK